MGITCDSSPYLPSPLTLNFSLCLAARRTSKRSSGQVVTLCLALSKRRSAGVRVDPGTTSFCMDSTAITLAYARARPLILQENNDKP